MVHSSEDGLSVRLSLGPVDPGYEVSPEEVLRSGWVVMKPQESKPWSRGLWSVLGGYLLVKKFLSEDMDRFRELSRSDNELLKRVPNLNADPIRVAHASLERWSEESDFKAHCPTCKDGLLLVHRDKATLRIQREDRCISCAQRFIYTDNEIGGEALPLEDT